VRHAYGGGGLQFSLGSQGRLLGFATVGFVYCLDAVSDTYSTNLLETLKEFVVITYSLTYKTVALVLVCHTF